MNLLAHPGHIEHDLPAWLAHPAGIVICLSIVAICGVVLAFRVYRRPSDTQKAPQRVD